MGLPKKKKSKKLKENRSKGKRKKKEVRGVPCWGRASWRVGQGSKGSRLLCLGLWRKISAGFECKMPKAACPLWVGSEMP